MNKLNIQIQARSSIFHLFFLVLGCCIAACNGHQFKDRYSDQESLFRLKMPQETGVEFSNILHENDTFNSIFYEYYYNGAGLAIGDVNNDGLSDVFFAGNMVTSRLYLNQGNLKFEDVTEKSGINTLGSWVTGVSMADINQDGWLDIYLCVGGNISDDYRNLLFINNGASGQLTFSEHARSVGLDEDSYSTQAAFFDFDLDGDLDVYILTSSMNIPNKNSLRGPAGDGSMRNTDKLFRNEGIDPATQLPFFKDVSSMAGITWDGFGLGIAISDINKDGWPDIYVANDYISNDLLYLNQGNGTFRESFADHFKHTSYSAMGMDIADFNNDGLVDVFTLDMLPENYYRKRIMAGNMREYRRYQQELEKGYARQYIRNMLQLNNGEISGRLTFSEIGQLAGVFETDWSWAPLFADFDNDGLKDLFIGNGIPRDLSNMDFSTVVQNLSRQNPGMPFSIMGPLLREELDKMGNVKKPNVIYRNMGSLLFEDKTGEWGMGRPSYSTGAAFSDLDNDGDLDLVLNNLEDLSSIYENTLIDLKGPDSLSHYLQFRLLGPENNKEGIGTKLTLYYNGNLQYYEHFPVRGFQSMMDPKIHFGLGPAARLDTLHVCWPDGMVQTIYDLTVDQLMPLSYSNATPTMNIQPAGMEVHPVFMEVSGRTGIEFYHKEREFVDFSIQPLLPHMFSKEGPGIAVGDINADGLEDFYIGSATGFFSAFFLQQKEGHFTSYPLHDNPNYEDMGSLLFDADSDGDNDLYVVSGGTGLPPGNPFYSDRLYLNNGKGEFSRAETALPDNAVCGSQVTACDFDRDGDLDLFVCGRIKLENYPLPDRSFLLRNDSEGPDKVRFTDITTQVADGLDYAGLVSSALWTDYDMDGWMDLILAGEWMPLTIYKNEGGRLINVTQGSGLAHYTGWWNSLAGADFDRDGDIDYIAGNHGLNSRYKVSQDQPMRIMAKDFDKNGYIDPVCSYYVQGKSYPIYHRNVLMDQLPVIQTRYKTYEDYARATIEDIFTEEQIDGAYMADSRYFNSAYIENLGSGKFKIHSLPVESQFAPVFGILTDDYNGDGFRDILLTGNAYSSNVDDGQYDASIGLFLEGDGNGGFVPAPGRMSGFFVDGDAKGLAQLHMGDGGSLVLAAQNSGKLKVFQVPGITGKVIRPNSNEVRAVITFENGKKENVEFYYGSGYLSRSSRICRIPDDVISLTLISYSGESRTIAF